MDLPDPMTRDEHDLDARAFHEDREARWTEFAEILAEAIAAESAASVVRGIGVLMAFVPDPAHSRLRVSELAAIDFAEDEGWHGVLACLARVLRDAANDQHRAEAAQEIAPGGRSR